VNKGYDEVENVMFIVGRKGNRRDGNWGEVICGIINMNVKINHLAQHY